MVLRKRFFSVYHQVFLIFICLYEILFLPYKWYVQELQSFSNISDSLRALLSLSS